MADTKLTDLTALTGASTAIGDQLYISDASESGINKSKSIRMDELATAVVTVAPAFVQSGTGAQTETVSQALRRMVFSGQYSSAANFQSAVAVLTDTAGIYGLAGVQAVELTPVPFLTFRLATAGAAPFEIHEQSYNNTGVGAGTFNHALFYGFNVGRHSSITATANKPSLIMGMEDNYYDDGGDAEYGMEWYVEYFSPDGTSVQQLRPFYTRVGSDQNSDNHCTTLLNIGSDGTGQVAVRAGATNLFDIVATAVTVRLPFAVATSGGTQLNVLNTASAVNSLQMSGAATTGAPYIASVGETDAPLRFSSSGIGSVNVYGNFFSTLLVSLASTGATFSVPLKPSAGTKAAPAIDWNGEGFYQRADGYVMVGAAGVEVAYFSTPTFGSLGSLNLGGSNGGILAFATGALDAVSPGLFIGIDAANNTYAQKNSTNAQEWRLYGSEITAGTRYSRLTIKHATTSVTAAIGATVTAANLIPAKANVLGVNTVVTTGLGTGTGTTGYAVGDGTDANRWGDVVGTVAGTDTDGNDATADPTGWFTAANNVVITAAGGNFDGTGVIFVDVAYTLTEAA